MNDKLTDLIRSFKNKRVLVIGEATSDIDLVGSSNRVAREAPVPIVQIDRVTRVPGRAANAAVNVAQLAGSATFLSVVGKDTEGEKLLSILRDQGVNTDYILRDQERQTQTVQRVVAGEHLLLRFDSGSQDCLNKWSESWLMRNLRKLFPQFDAVLISDYGYGVMSEAVVDLITDLKHQYKKPVIIDSKYLDKYKNIKATAVKPNYQEATRLLGIMQPRPAGKRANQIQLNGERLLKITGADYALVTLDVEGSVVLRKGSDLSYRTFSRPIENSKAVGAGDTYTAALTLSLAAGSNIKEAANISQAAAGIVVQKSGTVSCSQEELIQHFSTDPKCITDRQELYSYARQLRAEGRRIVFTNGCFDILHSGHVSYLNQARAQGDVLVVGLNSDESVRRLKGSERPVNSLEERIRVLAGLESVDLIVPFEENTPLNLIKIIQPDIYVKGGDYTRHNLPEAPVVEGMGGEVAIMPHVFGRSTTDLIARIHDITEEAAEGSTNAKTRKLGRAY